MNYFVSIYVALRFCSIEVEYQDLMLGEGSLVEMFYEAGQRFRQTALIRRSETDRAASKPFPYKARYQERDDRPEDLSAHAETTVPALRTPAHFDI